MLSTTRSNLLATAIAVVALTAGCNRAVHVTSARVDLPDVFERVEPLSVEFVDSLARASWTANPEWSPEVSNRSDWQFGDGPIAPRRWTFATLKTLADSRKNSAPEGGTPVDEDDDSVRRTKKANRLIGRLRRTAQRPDMAGWSSAVALTYWSPHVGAEFTSELEETMRRAEFVPPADEKSRERDLSDDEKDPSDESPPDKKNKSKSKTKIVRTRTTPMPLRCAAAEAWCLALASQQGEVELLLAPAGRAANDDTLPPVLRGELFRSLAHWIEPSAIPGLSAALVDVEQPDGSMIPAPVELRRAAMEACLIHAWMLRERQELADMENTASDRSDRIRATSRSRLEWSDSAWPAVIHRARLDPSPAVRKAYGRWLAVADCPDAFNRLKRQLSDSETHVREEACVSLGMLRSRAAFDELTLCATKPDERLREAAARGLAGFGPTALAGLSRDTTSRVRLVVAEGLAEHHGFESAVLLKPLLSDVDPLVQVRAARATRGWPDQAALPILVHGLKDGSLKTRDFCWRELARRLNLAGDFPIDGSESERRDAVGRLISRHRLPTGFGEGLSRTAVLQDGEAGEGLSRETIARIVDVLHTQPVESSEYLQAKRMALEWTERDLPRVERLLLERSAPLSPEFEADILATISPAYSALVDLESRDVFIRRKGAQALALAGGRATLSTFLVRRLADRMIREQDQAVWRSVMAAVTPDGTSDAAHLAELAVNHAWPDVRVLGCEYAQRHGQSAFAPWLLPLFQDPNRTVQYAAVRASGACHHPVVLDGIPPQNGAAAQPGLRSLLTSSDARLREAAVEAMARLGDEQGMNELVRLGFSDSPDVRERAARAMGNSGQTRFVESLIRIGWTESHGPVRKSALKALEDLVPPENRPPQLGTLTAEDGKIRAWSAWWQRQNAASP